MGTERRINCLSPWFDFRPQTLKWNFKAIFPRQWHCDCLSALHILKPVALTAVLLVFGRISLQPETGREV